MSRRTLTSNKRSFTKNPRSFIDRVTRQPLEIEIDDGVNPPYTVTVSPVSGGVTSLENLPPSVGVTVQRVVDPNLEEQ